MLESVFSFPDLQELIFEYECYNGPNLPGLKPVYHANLKNLLCCVATLSYLTLPALECLAVVPYDGQENQDISWVDNVTALIHRSECRLTDLHILEDACTSRGNYSFKKLFALLAPTLVVFGLDPSSSPNTQEIIHSITRTESSAGSLPCLEYLKFSIHEYYIDRDPIDFDSFVDAFTTTLISLRDDDLAEKWHAPLLKQVSVICKNDTLIARLRAACLDSLSSRGLEVGYAREPWTGVRTYEWHTTWYDRTRR
ncbi:hypothetical protein CYLTODRAFT_422932 [Cylindrobasidium torrendii FP15055 ss-10]|uniref:Uncharacterized protein n=1 Tax=Cylindrobasidium torrendii FP15055 ss-10 TaxID=1314674 RepID=A0A0D7BA03_9AGAR|nr:hypothetical protein CYLTODRAFT_422932 [Cylindrobasidium torrendii FP15055 ss-10]